MSCAQAGLSEISPIFVHDSILMDVPWIDKWAPRHSRGEKIKTWSISRTWSTLDQPYYTDPRKWKKKNTLLKFWRSWISPRIFLLAGAATTFMGRPKIGAGVDEMASSDFERAGRCLRITSHLLSMWLLWWGEDRRNGVSNVLIGNQRLLGIVATNADGFSSR